MNANTCIAIFDAPAAATRFPGNLQGSTITAYATAKNGTSATFTTTGATATWSSAPTAGTSAAVGDYVFCGDGSWGVLTAFGATSVTVDFWRSPNGAASKHSNVKPNTTTLSIMQGKNLNAGSTRTRLKLIYIMGTGAGAGTLTITDAKGTATSIVAKSIVDTGVANGAVPEVLDFGEGLPLAHPIGFTLSANVSRAYVVWSAE